MSKPVMLQDRVYETLTMIKKKYAAEYGDPISYSNIIRDLLKETERWEERSIGKLKKKSKKKSSDVDDE